MSGTTQKKATLCSILLEGGIVTQSQVDRALKRQIATGRLIGETLVELGYTTEENIGWALSKQLGIPYADIRPDAIDADLVKRFPQSLLRRAQAAPLFGNPEEIVVAVADPTDPGPVADLREAAGTKLSIVIGSPASIRRVLDTVFGPGRAADEALRAARDPKPRPGEEAPQPPIVWDRSGTTFLLYHVHTAREKRSSEIHFVPTSTGLSVSYRTDLGLEPQAVEQPEAGLYLRGRLAVLGVPDLDPDGAATSAGTVSVQTGGQPTHVAVCHCRADFGVTTVLRLSPALPEAPDLSTLGLSPIGEAEIRDFVDGPEGLVIVHGPPRSGGTTVLASLAALAARPHRRTLVFESTRVGPYPEGTTRIHVEGGSGSGLWERLAVGLGADVVILDDVLPGPAIDGVLNGAAVGRLVFARTDWLDGKRLLSFLARSRNGRAVLRDRPFAMITLPAARREGSGVWVTPVESESHAGILGATILTDEGRDALLAEPEA